MSECVQGPALLGPGRWLGCGKRVRRREPGGGAVCAGLSFLIWQVGLTGHWEACELVANA